MAWTESNRAWLAARHPTLNWILDGLDLGAMFSGVGGEGEDNGSLIDLNNSLASEEQTGEVAAGNGTAFAGAETATTLRDADRLAAQYGGQQGDWQKVASSNYNPGGARAGGFEITLTGMLRPDKWSR